MFKRLRERIAEAAEDAKFPVGQLNNNSGKQDSETKSTNENSTEDLIMLSDSSAVVVPQTSPRQFSIGDEDGSTSEQNTPQKKHNDAAFISTNEQPSYNTSQRNTPHGTGADTGFGAEFRPRKTSYIPQSDIESEREEPPTLNLESISKDQLLSIIDILKARVHKYKNKYSEVVKNYKEIRDEKLKIENTLIENQDKGLRRIAELREQCQLEQKAKAHLEANLRLLMEEKDSRISVLETQINLLKEGGKTDMKTFQGEDTPNSDASSGEIFLENSVPVQDYSKLKQKMERLEHQSSQAKKTITSQTEQLSILRKQSENMSQELEEKVKQLNEIHDKFNKQESVHEEILSKMKERLEELEKKEEESVMSMAETKRNMHVELEIKEKQLKKAEREAKEFQNNYESEKQKVVEIQKKSEERIQKLQHQVQSTEKLLEEEKQNLMQELTRGKTAAITLLQQECDKKLLRIEEEWKTKLHEVEADFEKYKLSQAKENNKNPEVEEKLKIYQKENEELKLVMKKLEEDNTNFKSCIMKLESECALTSEKIGKLQEENTELKKLNETDTRRYEEKLKQELNEKLQVREQTEAEHNRLCALLKEQLNEKQAVIDGMVHNKSELCNKIDCLEKKEIKLNKRIESLEAVVKESQSKLQDLQVKFQDLQVNFQVVSERDSSKSKEICDLNNQLEKIKSNEKSHIEDVNKYQNTIDNLKLENTKLEANVNMLIEDSKKVKIELLASNKEVEALKNELEEAVCELHLISEVLDQKLDSVTKLVSHYNQIKNSIVLQECKENKTITEEKVLELCSMNSNLMTENLRLESSNTKKPQNTTNDLLKENQKLKQELIELKELSEIQNIEFAKNITQLNESLNELQEERNNLSLVLQSIESQGKEINPESVKSTTNSVSKDNKSSALVAKHEMDIAELNNKVKLEIDALSSQTELVNQELKNLREQFNISQLTYSEKVAQLNSKLLLRTEKLVAVKNDLDASVQNAEELKILLDSMQEELKEKEELLRFSEIQKQETEKVLKEKHIELELSLKQTHNSQLSALKEQTKATIEKLNKEIKKANDKLKESEIKFQSKLVSVEDKEILYKKENSEHLLQCKRIVCNVLEKSVTLENALKRLDVYGSLIINLNAKIHLILKKLQEKDYMIINQQSQIDAFENKVKFLTDESSNFQNLKIKFEEISGFLEKCKCELEKEKSEKNLSEENLLNLQKSSEAEIKELKSVNDCFEKEKDAAIKSASTFQTMYEKLISNFDQFTLKVNDNMDNIAVNIEKYESKVKSSQSDLCDVSVRLKAQINENYKLQLELKEISEFNESLLKFKESHNITETQLKQDLEQKIENLNETEKTYKKEVQHLQKNLEDALSKLKVTEENNKSQSNEIQKLKSVLDCLEEEKDDALKSAIEFKSMYEKILFNLDQFTSKANVNMEKMTINIDNHEAKLKYLKSHYGNVSLKLETQIKENSQLKKEFEEISGTNKRLLKEIESHNVSETQLQKDFDQKYTKAEKSFKKDIEERQMKLDEALSKLKVAEANSESQNNEITSLNNALKEAILNLKEMEKIVEKQKSKVLAEQNSIKEWESKCSLAVVAAKEASNAVTELEAKSEKLLEELIEKKSLIDTMMPKEELESFKKLNDEKINKMNAKIDELQKLVDSLTTEVTEKKSIIKKIQNEQSNLETRSEESLKCLKDKLENAEKNYFTQMDEMKSRLSLLEKEKLALKTEKAELLKGQEKLTDLKNIESAIKAELKSKEEELKKIQQKHETTVKEQLAKIHSFQETMKDKENMILKLKANIETLNKDNSERNDELKKKIKALEVEREQLMMQAQERVSITEAKYREDIKALQEKNNKLLQENSEMEKLKLKIEHLAQEDRENCSRLEALKEEILLLKEKLSKADERLSEAHNLKQSSEVELLGKLQVLQAENSSLLGKTNHFESLKAEKEELNEKLKDAEHQMTSIKELESERDKLKTENIDLIKQLDALKSNQEEDSSSREKLELLRENENVLRIELGNLRSNKEDLEAKHSESNSLYETEIQALKLENEKLSKQIRMLEKFHTSDPESTSVKEYIATVRGECEAAMKAKDEELETKLKHLVRDFCIQMDVKDKDCDKMIAEMIEKSQDAEDKLLREHRKEASELRQSLFEKECALDEMRDHYEETLQQKEKKIKELQKSMRKMADGDLGGGDVPPISEEGSDWDDTWAVPEESVENASQVEGLEPCKDHLQQIESLQEEVTKCNSEIKELKILLRLSPPESMVNNNNRRESLQQVPEPTEFEYLKNIIYEYMMGKEPITLVKVIAAVLRFSDTQTQQVIRREESKHPMR